ncbi:L-arabinose transporter ATP-binding protein [compost metagenome]
MLISEDLDEVLQLADRILVMYDGRIVGDIPREAASREHIGLLMAGSEEEAG